MQDKIGLSKFPPLTTIGFLAVVCLLLAQQTDNQVFSFVTGGKSLDGRNLAIQFLFAFIYFSILLILSLLIFHKHVTRLLVHPYPLYCLLMLAPLAAHAYVGSFSRFVADDFSSAALTVNKGVLGATWDWYVNWTGRFSASFFDSLAGYLGPSSMKYAVAFSLVLLVAGMVLFASKVISGSLRQRIYTGLFLSSLALTSAFFIAPDLPQSLYWGQGMRSLIIPLIPLFFVLAILTDFDTEKSRNTRMAAFLSVAFLSFVAGGFGETYLVIQTTIFGLVILRQAIRKPFGFLKRSILTPLIALIFSIAAMAVTVLAPGNQVRQTYFPEPPSLFGVFTIAMESMGKFFDALMRSPENLILLVFITMASFTIGCLYAIEQKSRDSSRVESPAIFRVPGVSFFIISAFSFILLIFVSFLPSAYAMSTTPPPRTLVLPSLIFSIALITLGFAAGLNSSHRFSPRRWVPVIPNSGLALLAAGFVAVFSLQVTTHILKVVPDYRFFATRFDRADKMIREAKSAGESTVTVPEVHNHFGLSDYGEGTTYWLDDAVDKYYGLHVIINKHMK